MEQVLRKIMSFKCLSMILQVPMRNNARQIKIVELGSGAVIAYNSRIVLVTESAKRCHLCRLVKVSLHILRLYNQLP
jgi:hypothetical protein